MTRGSRPENRPTQTARLVALLRERSPRWVPLPEILNLRISQYVARVYQARHEWGLKIESRVEIVDGEKHSWFRLIEASTAKQSIDKPITPSAESLTPFAEEGR